MRRKLATASWLVAVVLALVVSACGGSSSDDNKTTASKPAANANALKKGTTVNFWIMPNGPQPQADMEKTVKPFEDQTGVKVNVEVVGWDVQLDRIKNAAVSGQGPDVTQAGTTQVPFFAALGGFSNLNDRVADIGGKDAYAPGVWQTTQLAGHRRHLRRAVVHRGAGHLLPQGRPEEGRDRSRDRLHRRQAALQQTLQTIKDKVPDDRRQADLAVRHAGQEGVRPRPPRDAVRVGQRRRRAVRRRQRSRPSTAPRPRGASTSSPSWSRRACSTRACSSVTARGVENQFKGGRLAVWIGGPWVLSTITRTDDKNWVPAARANVGVAAMPTGPAGKAFTFVGGSNLMVFKASKNQNEAWALIKYLSSDAVQKNYADLLSFFPARLAPQEQVGKSDANHKAFYSAIKQGRTYAPIAQWGQIENAYKGRFGNILDSAAGQGKKPFSEGEVKSELDAAAKEADALLAQGG